MAEWKLCSDKGLSALPAAISERCHRYGDGRLFSLIIGNCECVSVPVHGYSNIKDTCQRKPVLWIWWAQQLLWKCTGLCLMCSQMRGVVGAVDADIKLFMKGPWRKRALTENLSHCLRLTKQKLTYVQWNSGEVREIKWKKKISDIVHGGMFGACMWCYHSDGISPWRGPGRCAAGRGGLVTSHCSKLDDMQLLTRQPPNPEIGLLSHLHFFLHFRRMLLHNRVLCCDEMSTIAEKHVLLTSI